VSLVRVQTVWSGVAGAPYYTNLYAIGPLSTNNGNDLAVAWRVALNSLVASLASPMTAQIDSELLEFDETTGVVTGAGTTSQAVVTFTGSTDQLPHQDQLLIRWSTSGIVHNRRVSGRTFLPGQLESNSSSAGVPNTGITTPVASALTALLTTMSNRMRIWARPFDGTPTNPVRPGSAHAITGASIAPYWAVLRSRRD
jgi:hypothetical protein